MNPALLPNRPEDFSPLMRGNWVVTDSFDETYIGPPEAFAFAIVRGPYQHVLAQAMSATPELIRALSRAEQFIAGFEEDRLQSGVDELLVQVRAALALSRGDDL